MDDRDEYAGAELMKQLEPLLTHHDDAHVP
jgi:hypothetical protein